jgi:hypothetical protein
MNFLALPTLVATRPVPPALLRCLQADALKLRHTAALRLAVGTAVLPVLLIFLVFGFYGKALVKPGHNPWNAYLMDAWNTWTALILPLLLVLLAALVVQVEHRANAWKHLYALPIERGTLLLSKLLILLGLSLLAQATYALLLLLTGAALGWLRPGLGFQHAALPVPTVLLWLGRTYVASVGLLTVQYVVSVARRSFVVPMALGLAGLTLSLALASVLPAGWLPYADPLLTLKTIRVEAAGLAVAPRLAAHEWGSLLWAAVAALLGLGWLRRHEAA